MCLPASRYVLSPWNAIVTWCTDAQYLQQQVNQQYVASGAAIGNAYEHVDIYERVLSHEREIVQAYKEEQKSRTSGRGGLGNIKKPSKENLNDAGTCIITSLSSAHLIVYPTNSLYKDWSKLPLVDERGETLPE